jgi:mono/diheme cytochrome c family protein
MIERYVNAEELQRLFSTLIVILGALMIAALFATILVPGLRNANQPAAAMPVNPVVGDPGWLDPAEFPPEKGKIIPPVDPQILIGDSPELNSRGKAQFEKDCVQCHGTSGLGDGSAASTMNPRPRNFSSPENWVNGSDLAAIYRTLSEGIRGSAMAPFDYMAKRDRMALAHYVQSLGKFPHPAPAPAAMETLTKILASAGEKTPNRIPVSLAMVKLEREYLEPVPLVVGAEESTIGARLLRRAVVDPVRAALRLAGSEKWRAGIKELAETVVSGAPGNGFSVSAATLSAADWKEILDELIRRLPQKK